MRFRKSEYSVLEVAVEAALRFRAGILCNTRVYSGFIFIPGYYSVGDAIDNTRGNCGKVLRLSRLEPEI